MRTILCLQHYRGADPGRQRQIDACLERNLRHPALAEAVVWVEPGAPPPPGGTVPVEFRPLARRLRFADWLRLAAERRDAIVLLANADICLEAGFDRLERLLPSPEVALALSRHEAAGGGREPWIDADPHWRQDCWAIRGDAPIDDALTGAAELPLGRPGADNRIAHVLWCHGLRLCNPVLQLRALHHQERRTSPYDRHPERLFGACAYVHPSLAPGEASELEHRIWSRQPERSGGLQVQVEPIDGDGGLQSYGALAEPASGSAGPTTPFQERRALAELRQRTRLLPSHELAGAPAAPAWAAGVFLPLAALRGNGSRLSLLRPQRLLGIALRLPLARAGGRRLRLRLAAASGGGEEEHRREWALSPSRAGERLLLPPDWPARPLLWLQLTLVEAEEGADPAAEGETFLELQLLAEPCPQRRRAGAAAGLGGSLRAAQRGGGAGGPGSLLAPRPQPGQVAGRHAIRLVRPGLRAPAPGVEARRHPGAARPCRRPAPLARGVDRGGGAAAARPSGR